MQKDKWNNIFNGDLKREGSLLAHFTSCLIQNWYFVYKLKQYLPGTPSSILEAGAGTGYLTAYLSSLGHKVTAMDIDTHFIEKTNSFFNSGVAILNQDIRQPFPSDSAHFNLIYNIGVMEHFIDQDIIGIFKNFKAIADTFIFAVPNFKIPYSYGDERYLPKRHWQKLLGQAGWMVKEVFSYNRYGLRKYLSGFVSVDA